MALETNTNSLSDLFNSAKNLVIAINGLAQNVLLSQGTRASQSLQGGTVTQVVPSGAGRVVRVSVTTAGAMGMIYDSNSATPLASSLLAIIPAKEGVFNIKMPYLYGLVVETGAGQVATVVYS